MSNNRSIRWVLLASAAVCLSATISDTAGASFVRGCATRDLQVLMLIEQRERADAAAMPSLIDAMMHARMVCDEGRIGDALALYDAIARALTSIPALSDRTP